MRIQLQSAAEDEFARKSAQAAVDLPAEEVKPGPSPDDPRLCLRKPRQKDWPHKGQKEWTIRFRNADTGKNCELRQNLPKSQRKEAEKRLALLKSQLMAKTLGLISPRKVPMTEVCAWWIKQFAVDEGATKAQTNRYRSQRRYLLNISEHFAGKTLGDFDQAAVTSYLNARMKMQVANWGGRPDAPMVSRATAMSELYCFRRALKLYKEAAQLSWAPLLSLPYVVTRRDRFLTQEEFQDLLLACDGRIKDPATGEWRTEDVVDESSGQVVTRFVTRDPTTILRRQAMKRVYIIGAYVGCRHQILANLTWRYHPSRPCFDVEEGLIVRNGYLEDGDKGKPRPTSALRPEILPYLEQWRAEDLAAGHEYVVRKLDGEPYAEFNHVFNDVVADAGLGPEVTPHVLRHTAITWLLQDGYPLSDAADMVGMTVSNMFKYYRQWTLQNHVRAVRRHTPTVRLLRFAPFDAQDVPKRAMLYAPPSSASGNRRHPDKARQRPVRLRGGELLHLGQVQAASTFAR